ncbi:MAG: hypothetical protein ACOYNS_06860 [Bacteroidota bacterium]
MFEQELEDLQKITVNNTIANTQTIALKSILESNIPANIKSFFRGEVEWLLFQEKKTDHHSSKFNYLQEDVQLLQEQMDILLVYHYTFSREEFLKTLDKCVLFLFNYLCRPQWTLESYLFEEKNVLNIKELALKFRFCGDYQYYWTILEKYLVGKDKKDLERDEAVRILRRIDAEIVNTNSAEEMAKMTIPFYEFVGYVHQQSLNGGRGDLPTRALMYFFEDKKLSAVHQHLQKLREQGKQSLLYYELIEALKDSFTQKSFSVADELAQVRQPQKKNFTQLNLHEKEKTSIIKSLFGDDESKYIVTMEKILSSATWDDAGLSLDHYFTMNDVDPFSRDAIVLTNALQTYFINRESH